MAESDDSCSDQEFNDDYQFHGSITRYQKDTMTVEQDGYSKYIIIASYVATCNYNLLTCILLLPSIMGLCEVATWY